MDVDDEELLIPSNDEESDCWKAKAAEISINFTRIGITLLVLGVLATLMGIFSVWAARGDIDAVGEGIWCGISVMASFIMNLISAGLLMFGIIFSAVSTFQYTYRYSVDNFILFGLGLNIWLCACFPICIYLSIVYYKILKQNKKNYCEGESSGYRLVYVPVKSEHANGP